MIWEQDHKNKNKKHIKTYPNMNTKPQISTCVMFGEMQERFLKTIKKTETNQATHPIWLVDWSAGWLVTPKIDLSLHT